MHCLLLYNITVADYSITLLNITLLSDYLKTAYCVLNCLLTSPH